MSERMTAEQAWAEADRLDAESDAACVAAETARMEWRRLSKEANQLTTAWGIATDAAEAIGPRPVKVPS